jgi:hypothetical protein
LAGNGIIIPVEKGFTMGRPVPPLIMIAYLAFWGWQTGLLPIAAIMAIVYELPRWIHSRWKFSQTDLNRITDLCAVIFLAVAVFQAITDFRHAFFGTLQWIPVVLFPLMAAQLFSTENDIDIRTFFFLLRNKISKRDPGRFSRVNLMYPYLIACIFAAGAANVRDDRFYIIAMLLAGYALFWVRNKRFSIVLWLTLLLCVGVCGYMGQSGLKILHVKLQQWIIQHMMADIDPLKNRTAIGDVGQLKPSDRIMFRIRGGGDPGSPLLIRETAYSGYFRGTWTASGSKLNEILPADDGMTWIFQSKNDQTPSQNVNEMKKSREMQVALYLSGGHGVLKLLRDTWRISQLPAGAMTRNHYGAVMVSDAPGMAIYTLDTGPWGAASSPNPEDLMIPNREKETLIRVAGSIGILGTSDNIISDISSDISLPGKLNPEKLKRIRLKQNELNRNEPDRENLSRLNRFFQDNFTYTLKLSGTGWNRTALEQFLNTSRAGHCEYFATATVLLLRTSGIPARYVRGYAAQVPPMAGQWEPVRERHAHAWAEAYINGAWQDVDFTPPGWLEEENAAASRWQAVGDFFSYLRFLFMKWRHREGAGSYTQYLRWPLIPLVLFLAYRVFARKRQRAANTKHANAGHVPEEYAGKDSELYQLVKKLEALGFSRPPWETLTRYFRRTAVLRPNLSATPHLENALALHQRYRFDPKGLSRADRHELARCVHAVMEIPME